MTSNQIADIQWTDADIFTLLLDDGDISSSSSDSSDWSGFEDDDVVKPPGRAYRTDVKRKPVVIQSLYRSASQHLSDEEFFEEFRINRNLVDSLAEEFRGSRFYDCSASNNHLSAYDNVLIFLWFAGHKASFRKACDQFGISHSSLYRIIRRMSGFLSSLSSSAIAWLDEDGMKASAEYYRLKGIPFAIGAITIDQITMDAEEENSVPLQIVSDHRKRIIHAYVGDRCSKDMSTVFTNSNLDTRLEQLCSHYVILGNHNFPCLRNLLTPYRRTVEPKRKLFNQMLSQGRGTVEGCMKKLKLKFPQLERVRMQMREDVKQFITACCVLHNLSLDDDFLQHTVGRTLQSVVRSEAAAGCSDMKDTPQGLAYRDDLLTAISIRRNWR